MLIRHYEKNTTNWEIFTWCNRKLSLHVLYLKQVIARLNIVRLWYMYMYEVLSS